MDLAKLLANDDTIDELYQRVDVPLKVMEDGGADGRQFILCEHNRDGDSYRSPWSNTYFPPLDDGFRPPERLRLLELHANEVFDYYRELYYGKSTSVASVYLWEKDGNEKSGADFVGSILIRNKIDDHNYWNSIHVVDVTMGKGKACSYDLTSTILLSITPNDEETNPHVRSRSTNVSGSISRHNVRECTLGNDDSGHIVNIGKFVEDVECSMRSELDGLYIQKTKSIVETIRKKSEGPTQRKDHTKILNEAVLAMTLNRKTNLTT
jgi:capping protein beta